MKVLILAYDFPPYTSMGGQRPYGWLHYLPEFDIKPTVITRHWPKETKSKADYCRSCLEPKSISLVGDCEIIRVPYKANLRDQIVVKFGFERFGFIRQILSLFYSVFQFSSYCFDNKSGIYEAGIDKLKTEKFDLIISTGEPFILFKYAYRLSKTFDVPWVADYRDCWSDNYEVNQNGGFTKFIYQSIFRYCEKKYVITAQAITTAAPVFKDELQKLFLQKNISVIYNGFVQTESTCVNEPSINKKKLKIGFAGTIYPFQPVEIFLDGLALFTSKHPGSNIEAVFWGSNFSQTQRDRINNFNSALATFITTTDRLDKTTLFNEMETADMLLILDNKGMISGKLYEYLLFGRKVLMAGRDHGAMEEILNTTNSGIICDTPEEIAEALEKCYAEWQETGTVKCESKNIEQYSRREQTKKLAELIKSIC